MREQGTPTFYDDVRRALGAHNPDGDVSTFDLCLAIKQIVYQLERAHRNVVAETADANKWRRHSSWCTRIMPSER